MIPIRRPRSRRITDRGIGFVNGARCLLVATDAGIHAGAMTEAGNMKLMRCQEIALENRLPFIHLVESAGEPAQIPGRQFIRGGGIFYNLARLSAAGGIPVITVVHGPSTAGGAYMPGLSDYVVMVWIGPCGSSRARPAARGDGRDRKRRGVGRRGAARGNHGLGRICRGGRSPRVGAGARYCWQSELVSHARRPASVQVTTP